MTGYLLLTRNSNVTFRLQIYIQANYRVFFLLEEEDKADDEKLDSKDSKTNGLEEEEAEQAPENEQAVENAEENQEDLIVEQEVRENNSLLWVTHRCQHPGTFMYILTLQFCC